MAHNYLSISPSEFETLAADILSAVHSVHFERYGEGPDGGIDCKHVTAEGEVWIGQAKRYKDVKALLRLIPKEKQKMMDLEQKPTKYFLVAACSLSPTNKNEIVKNMQPFVCSTGDIYGAEDLDALLYRHPAVYRKHHCLWLHGVEQLNHYLHQAYNKRAEEAQRRIVNDSKHYVVPAAQQNIIQLLATDHSCLIVGDPGVGKSVTAGQVALQLLLEEPGAELIWLDDRNFEQALKLIRSDTTQIIVLDDFLGATFLRDDGMLAFKRDWHTLLFQAQQLKGKLKLLFTTRNYILDQALARMDDNSRHIQKLCKCVICLKHDNAKFRAELVYSLVKTANFSGEQLAAIVEQKLYWPLIKTNDFSPRLIEMYCFTLAQLPATQLKPTIEHGISGQEEL